MAHSTRIKSWSRKLDELYFRICRTQWTLPKWRTSWVCTLYETEHGTSRQRVRPVETVCMKDWTGCLLSSKTRPKPFPSSCHHRASPILLNVELCFQKRAVMSVVWHELFICSMRSSVVLLRHRGRAWSSFSELHSALCSMCIII